jgi:hypothetical protein
VIGVIRSVGVIRSARSADEEYCCSKSTRENIKAVWGARSDEKLSATFDKTILCDTQNIT